jgi:flavin reductase (DIM6/NTAB) family NADH-FMN oxidoreductase RutF
MSSFASRQGNDRFEGISWDEAKTTFVKGCPISARCRLACHTGEV